MKSVFAFLAALLLGVTPAFAQTWTGPDPERRVGRFGQGDVDFVLSELCYPFMVQNTPAAELVARHRLPRGFGSRDWAGGEPFYLVGQANVWASFRDTPEQKTCSLSIQGGDVARYRETILARIATYPTPLTPSLGAQPTGNYSERLLFCSAPGAGPTDIILVSLGGAPRVAVMLTVGRFPERPHQCDDLPTAPPPAQ